MIRNSQTENRRQSVRTAIDSVLLFRAAGMDNFRSCKVISISTQALEMISERSIPEDTIITIALETKKSPKRFYRIQGKVLRREHRKGVWMHVIILTSKEHPWPPMFLHDVMNSTYTSPVDEVHPRRNDV